MDVACAIKGFAFLVFSLCTDLALLATLEWRRFWTLEAPSGTLEMFRWLALTISKTLNPPLTWLACMVL